MWVSAALPLGVRHMLQQSSKAAAGQSEKLPQAEGPDRKGGFK